MEWLIAACAQAIVHDNEASGAIGPALAAANSHCRRSGGRVDGVDVGKVRVALRCEPRLRASDCMTSGGEQNLSVDEE